MGDEQTSTQATLGRSFELPNGQVIKNRLLKSAMSETLAPPDNRVPDTMATLYGRWAQGGIGLSVTGNVMVDRGALGEPGNVAVEDERDLDALKRWAQAGQKDGSRIYMQVNHPGRQVPKFLNRESVSPSAVPFAPHMRSAFATPRALTEAEIETLVTRYATTASVAAKAGFDGVQIHGAHGYLVSQFLSPHTNRRDDKWGGSRENRRRFALEVYRAMRRETPEGFGVAIKINSADFQKGGISEDESTETIVALAAEGMDFVEISGGTYEAPKMMSTKRSTQEREAYFLAFAEQLRSKLRTPLVVTGGFRSGGAMAAAIDSGAVDMVGLARPLAVRPDFPNDLLARGDISMETPPRKTGIGAIDRLGMMELAWYERQLHRMGAGKEPKENENVLWSMIAYMTSHGPAGFLRTRRAR